MKESDNLSVTKLKVQIDCIDIEGLKSIIKECVEDSIQPLTEQIIRQNGNAVYTVAEVAAIIKKSKRTVIRYITKGIIKGNRNGGKHFVTNENLNKYLR